MTVAMIREAHRLVEHLALRDSDIVSFNEVGSEGALLRLNAFATPGVYAECWMIARDGTSRKWPS